MHTYDYIVAGGGSAGCVVVNRLVKAGKSVLLIESGPRDNTLFIHIPATFIRVHGTERMFSYRSEPQPGAANRTMYVPQGRTLGGGSSVNAMVYIRGTSHDYDGWKANGCEGWGWDDVLPVFKRAEGHMRLSGPYHGTTGTLKVSDTRYRHPLSLAFVRGAQDCGLPYNDDFNGARQEGIGFYHTTTFDGRRGSTAATYLKEVQGRHNLEVRTGSSVTRVVITNGRATGVEWRAANGETGIAHAREEVILASGALATPKILMLSGIGPGEHLRAHGIEVVANSAQVGQNYQDHLEVPVYGKAKEPCSLLGNDQGIRALKHGMQWAMYRTGLLTSNVVECGGFVDTSGQGCADIQFHVVPTLVGDVERQPLDGHGISISPCILRPSSRGSVMLRSRDPNDPILFDSGALAQESDVATLVRGVQLGRSIMRSPSMASVISEELLPSPAADMEEQAVAAYVRQYAKTVYHPAGTCRMGGPDAVLAPDLRVRGVTGLRVCDASAMPSIVSGNTNAPTIMIAERCADFALQANRT